MIYCHEFLTLSNQMSLYKKASALEYILYISHVAKDVYSKYKTIGNSRGKTDFIEEGKWVAGRYNGTNSISHT